MTIEELKKEFGILVFFEIEDQAAWEDALDTEFACHHPLWSVYEETGSFYVKLKISRDFRKIAGY